MINFHPFPSGKNCPNTYSVCIYPVKKLCWALYLLSMCCEYKDGSSLSSSLKPFES